MRLFKNLLNWYKTKPRYGYMCQTDFDWELGEANGGSDIYPSVADLKKNRSCVKNCGIVKVKVILKEIIQEENRDWMKRK